MKLPKYIQKKIEKQNNLVYEANRLQLEIEEWCTKVGIDIYSEKYNTQEVKHAPEKLGSGSLEAFADVSKAAINAAAKFMEQSDELNSGKIYADTVLAADKLIKEYSLESNVINSAFCFGSSYLDVK